MYLEKCPASAVTQSVRSSFWDVGGVRLLIKSLLNSAVFPKQKRKESSMLPSEFFCKIICDAKSVTFVSNPS